MALLVHSNYWRIVESAKEYDEINNQFVYKLSIVSYKNKEEREKDKIHLKEYNSVLKKIDLEINKLEEKLFFIEKVQEVSEEEFKSYESKIKEINNTISKFEFIKSFIRQKYYISYDETFDKGFIQYKMYSLKNFLNEYELDISFLLDPVFIDAEFVDFIRTEKDLDNYYEIYKEYLDRLETIHEDC